MQIGSFSISGFTILVVFFLVMMLVRMWRGKRAEAKVEKVDHGEVKPVALSKVLKMKDGLAVPTLKLSGPILASSHSSPIPSSMVTYGDLFAQRIMMLAQSASVAAIVVEISTPGGSPVGSERIREAIVRAQELKPVFVYVSEMSASGGMWAMSTAKDITAAPATILGSVGVISAALMQYVGIKKMTGFLGKGVEADSIKGKLMYSGSGKGLGHPFAAEDAEAEARMQAWLDDTRADFVDLVASREGVDRGLLEAQGASVYGPRKALEIGVIDRVLSRFDFDKHVAKTIGVAIDELKFVIVARVKPSPTSNIFGFANRLTQTVSGESSLDDPLMQLRKAPMLMMLPSYLDH